ncbi:DUF4349 domain-containing protein [Epilithonimonas lactis]|uniref:DUF4349 domain-containing protein n=1 Tax=Epilithonimonas lactis TaxID=421072 RepID=A0A085B6L9_9FLAO|nr:DUF4349 domain-containing protein [Epilithonimonas lactis]KFC18114.1 hypothetical protein IO89_18455 [Epilithonimonas lactis]SER11568.1 protein of unknown function [Epilithonimonas lactis]
MKKLILTILVMSTLTMCKKSDIQEANNTIANADSLVQNTAESVEKFDAAANTIVDSVNLKAKDLIKNKEEIEKAFENSKNKIDSISENVEKFKKDIEEKKLSSNIDSIKNSIKKEIPKPVTKTVNKIVYRDKPKQDSTPKPASMMKKGYIEINVDDIATGKALVQDQIRKYDGIIKTENLISNDEFQTYYITAKVPLQKFDYLVEELSDLGSVKNKNVEIVGNDYNQNKMCDIEITMYGNKLYPTEAEKDQSFGSKSLDAVSSGWDVIGSILLFLLPFWPVFLIAGIAYYFYKKKNNKNQDPPENKDSNENS